MARDLHDDFRDAVTSQVVRPFALVQFFFDSETVRFWNGYNTFQHDGDEYTGAGDLLNFGSFEETNRVEARGFTMTLSGVPPEMVAIALNEKYQGRKVTVDIGFLDENGVVLGSPFRFFSGEMDVMSILTGGTTATISLSSENDLIILQRVNERRRTVEDQKLQNVDDTFFEAVTSLQSKSIVWG